LSYLGTQMPHVRVPRFFQPVTAVRSVEPGAAGATKRRERGVSTGQRPTALVTSPGRRVHARDVPGVAHHVFAHRDRGFARHRFGVSDPGTRACVPEVMRKQSRRRFRICRRKKEGKETRKEGMEARHFIFHSPGSRQNPETKKWSSRKRLRTRTTVAFTVSRTGRDARR
jgi:hypothetical protein